MNHILQRVDQWLGQTETWLYEQVRRLPPIVQSHVVCNSTSNLEQYPWPHIYPMNGRTLRKAIDRLGIRRSEKEISRVAQQLDAGLIHSHFGNVGWCDSPAAQRSKLPHIVTFYGYDVVFLPQQFPKWQGRYRELFASADQILCEGPHMAQRICKLGCPREKVRVHHLGVAIDEIKYQPRTWKLGEVLRVLLAATFHEKKGLPYAIRALGELNRKIPLAITLIGDETKNSGIRSDKANILRAIDECKLTSVTRMLGFQSHGKLLREAYSHHIYMAPSITAANGDTEGGAPISLIEMIATGMPVIATRHCDIPNVVIDGETGLLADERDVDGLAMHLQWLVDHPDEWTKFTDAGRARVEREFDSRIQGDRLAAIYQERIAA